jgi:hypothetical protein
VSRDAGSYQHHDRHAQRHAEGENITEQMSIGYGATDHDGDANQGRHTGGEPQPTPGWR